MFLPTAAGSAPPQVQLCEDELASLETFKQMLI
jgi:hypothetical protein